jgi:hypothetical protein
MVAQEKPVTRLSARTRRIMAKAAAMAAAHRQGQRLWSPEGLAEAEAILDEFEPLRKDANMVGLADD